MQSDTPIYVHPAELELVIINLAVNSRDATSSGGEMLVHVSAATLRGRRCHAR